ncbi:MAG: glycosyltransferase family 4 protein [Oceanospirillaceae bacterium]|nr:glycosyltransferase family 4 protein [Oceanospirillaceae bacterium]
MNDRITRLVGNMEDTIESRVIDLSNSNSSNEIGVFGVFKVLKGLGTYVEFIKLLVSFHPQIVFFNFSSRGVALLRDYVYCLLMKVFRTRYILYLQISGFDKRAESSRLWRFIYNSSFHNARVVTLSDRLSRELKQFNYLESYTLPNGIHPYDSELLKQSTHNGSVSKPKVIFLSNLMVEKGLFDLIEALGEVCKKGYQLEFQIVGAEADITVAELKKSLEEHNITGCSTYLGSKYNDEKWEALMNADIFVFPSHKEALPLVILEAMNCGLPILASDVGGIPDMIQDGKSGLLFRARDINNLKTKLEILIQDVSLRERLGAEAKTLFYEHFTHSHFEQRLKGLLEKLSMSQEKSKTGIRMYTKSVL